MAEMPNWFDKQCNVGIGDSPEQATAAIVTVLAKSPEIIAAVKAGLDEAAANQKAGKMGPTVSQFIRQRIAGALNKPG